MAVRGKDQITASRRSLSNTLGARVQSCCCVLPSHRTDCNYVDVLQISNVPPEVQYADGTGVDPGKTFSVRAEPRGEALEVFEHPDSMPVWLVRELLPCPRARYRTSVLLYSICASITEETSFLIQSTSHTCLARYIPPRYQSTHPRS